MLSLPRLLNNDEWNMFHYPLVDWSLPLATSPFKQSELPMPRVHGDKFNMNLNMNQFDPSEISVKFDKGQLTVHGKREKKDEDGSYVYREYKQMCTIPENVMYEQMKCRLDDKGCLRIEAPVKQEEKEKDERHIPIEFGSSQQAIKK